MPRSSVVDITVLAQCSTGPCWTCVGSMVQSSVGSGQICTAWSQMSAYNCYPDYVTGNSVLDTCGSYAVEVSQRRLHCVSRCFPQISSTTNRGPTLASSSRWRWSGAFSPTASSSSLSRARNNSKNFATSLTAIRDSSTQRHWTTPTVSTLGRSPYSFAVHWLQVVGCTSTAFKATVTGAAYTGSGKERFLHCQAGVTVAKADRKWRAPTATMCSARSGYYAPSHGAFEELQSVSLRVRVIQVRTSSWFNLNFQLTPSPDSRADSESESESESPESESESTRKLQLQVEGHRRRAACYSNLNLAQRLPVTVALRLSESPSRRCQ